MSFSIGIVGLPNVGKSTLFKALTKKPVDIGPYPFTTLHPNVGVVPVPDKRLLRVAEIIKPEKVTPTIIEFIDIAGLVKDSHKGEGLGNQFLAQIRNCDAVLEVVRAFEDPQVENVTGKIDPESDIETIKIELELKDLESKEKENLLSKKPVIYLLNINSKTPYQAPTVKRSSKARAGLAELRSSRAFRSAQADEGEAFSDLLAINLKDEVEMFELSEAERKELNMVSQLDRLILACYNILDLITFFTVAGRKETRAWTLKRGLKAQDAGGVVHTDFKEKFIRAEVINWQKLVEAGSWAKAREQGWIQTAGKDYLVQDGDVLEFKI